MSPRVYNRWCIPRVHRVLYTLGGIPRVCIGCTIPRWCIPRVYKGVLYPGGVYPGCISGYSLPVPWWVYTSLVYVRVYTHGYTAVHYCPLPRCQHARPWCSLPGEEALGSEERKPLGEGGLSLSGPKSVTREGRTLRIVTPLLPVRKTERLDSDRVFLRV